MGKLIKYMKFYCIDLSSREISFAKLGICDT